MHEYSVVQALLDQCEENARANNATAVTKVVTKIGRLSGIEPDLLQVAFDTFKEKTMCENAEFIMNIQEVVVYCNDCQKDSEIPDNRFKCPKCDSPNLNVVEGQDMFLMQLELEE
jgi:hydrogenase nickel incorporation protein HypA/HybF